MTLVMHGSIYAKSYACMRDSLQCMTLGITLYSIWHAVNGKQSVAAAHLQAAASAADLNTWGELRFSEI